jgi:hypothetical protein
MTRLLALLVMIAFVAGWTWLVFRTSGRRMWTPLWMAFSTTALAALFIGAGAIGYTLSKRARFQAGTAWTREVIWLQVCVGLALVPLAVFLWRKGLRGNYWRSSAVGP